jgi:hypothetical protein
VPLPFADRAVLDQQKVEGYLLSESHPVGRHKARVFRSLGYERAKVERLTRDLLEVARSGTMIAAANAVHGWRYIVDGVVRTPNGTIATIRTAWIVP